LPVISAKLLVTQHILIETTSSFPPNCCTAHLHKGARMVVAQQVSQRPGGTWVRSVLTIAKLKRWSINYYIDTAAAAEHAAGDLAGAGGGLGEYYSERETRTPVWLLAGDTGTVAVLVGLTDAQRAGGDADSELVKPPAGRRRRRTGARPRPPQSAH